LLDEVSAWQKEGVMFEFPLEHPLNHSIMGQKIFWLPAVTSELLK